MAALSWNKEVYNFITFFVFELVITSFEFIKKLWLMGRINYKAEEFDYHTKEESCSR